MQKAMTNEFETFFDRVLLKSIESGKNQLLVSQYDFDRMHLLTDSEGRFMLPKFKESNSTIQIIPNINVQVGEIIPVE